MKARFGLAHLNGRWHQRVATRSGALLRRQDLPETAFVQKTLNLAIEILLVSDLKIFSDRSSSCSIE